MFEKLKALPEFLNTGDLVNLGLYSSRNATYLARLNGNSPDFIKVGSRVLYPKDCLIEFLERNAFKGDPSQKNSSS